MIQRISNLKEGCNDDNWQVNCRNGFLDPQKLGLDIKFNGFGVV